MQNDVIKLVKKEYSVNDYGDSIAEETTREVFAEIRSIGMREKYEALQAGLDPEYTFVIADYYDYENETEIEYEGRRYRVIRTYRSGTSLEIVVTRDSEE